jgi:signal transduction histidine kinase
VPVLIIFPMWSTGTVPRGRATGGSRPGSASTVPASASASASTVAVGPAKTTLRSVIAQIATTIRYAGIVYIIVQVAVWWHSFYAGSPARLLAPALAVAWGAVVSARLGRDGPSALLTGVDSAAYLVLGLCAQGCVPPPVRDGAFSWVVIAMSGQLMIPAWYASRALSALVLASPLAYLAGAGMWPVTSARMMTGAAVLLLAIGVVHSWGRRVLYRRAATADAAVERADAAAREQYAVLCRNIERREHERLLHDTILNTLTAVARGSGGAEAEVVARCRRDVALMEAALGGAEDLAMDAVRPSDDLLSEVRGVVADMRARGLTVHLDADDGTGAAVPAQVITAMANAAREALTNVAAHAGTREAWVSVRLLVADGEATDPVRLRIAVRDRGAGFDLARVDQSRLGLRRSITERAAECGGQASVWSKPGLGTEVSLSWPAREAVAW